MSSALVPTLLETMSEACTKSLGQTVELGPASGGGAGGGGGASISAAVDKNTGKKYFIKKAALPSGSKMLHAEYCGVKAMAETGTIKVPDPIAFGEFHGEPRNCAFVVFEYLEFCRGGSGYELGRQLAKMHRCFSPDKKFGMFTLLFLMYVVHNGMLIIAHNVFEMTRTMSP